MMLRFHNIKGRILLALLAAALAIASKGVLADAPAAGAETQIDWGRAREHWSFRPPQARRVPAVRKKDWPRQPLDTFILARLEAKGLAPSPAADPGTLIRRVTFDLTGLPPSPEEVETFLKDRSPEAYSRVVDRLLASPAFGERMASMWLPLARYAEDQAHQVGSDTKFFYPNAYLYRQWVIDAFNRDLAYDRFIRLQLAADRLPDAGKEDLAAVGFLGLGPKYYGRGRLDVMTDEWQDRVDTVTRTFLGLTVGCARCHDHKFDPVTTYDYYALAGVFASTKMVNKAPDGFVEATSTEAAKMRKDTLHMVEEDTPRDLNVFIRGNVENQGAVVPRRFLRVLSEGDPVPFREGSGRKELAEAIAQPKNPLTARVLVNRVWGLFFGTPLVRTPSNFGLNGERPTHPELLDELAARFMQRGWSIKSLVREMVLSSTYRQGSGVGGRGSGAGEEGSGFRVQGSGADGRRQKAEGSGAAGSPNPQSAVRNPQLIDPENRLLWRMNRRRLSVEQWRDGLLSASGTLQPGGGPSMEVSDPANLRRTVYARVSRLKLNDILMHFDYPDANVHAEERSVTTTPGQKLFLLNSPLMLEQSRALAARLTATPAETDAARVRRAYLLLYSRPPTAEETRLGVAFLQQPEAEGMPRWERYAQVLLIANEMFYLD
jgi:uncharacterized protein DUF1549/uncharacterized protein DUF1553